MKTHLWEMVPHTFMKTGGALFAHFERVMIATLGTYFVFCFHCCGVF